MSKHHGMNELRGLDAFCRYDHPAPSSNRFGRMFELPANFTPASKLRALGAVGGPMDGGAGSDRTNSVPVGQVFFGQFIDHDITFDTTSSLENVASPEEVPNVRTPVLDLDSLFGSGPESSPYLYHAEGTFSGVKLLTGAEGTAASQPPDLAAQDLARSSQGTAIIGDPRNDENRIISQMQLAMIRFHNQVVDYLHDQGLEGGELFEHARELTTWHYQWVVIHDFLVRMCGGAVVGDILGQGRRFYCPDNRLPNIPVEFSVAAYRFGHSMIPQKIQIQRGEPLLPLFGPVLGSGFKKLEDAQGIVDWHELCDTDENRHVQRAEKLDSKLAATLLELPFINPPAERSLATRNLLRGQTFLLPSGEAVADAMGRDTTEIEIVSNQAQRAADGIELSSGTPLWFYVLVEAEKIGRETTSGSSDCGEGLGPVGARIVAETIIGLVDLDPRSFLSVNRNWTPDQGVGVSTLGEMLTYQN